jgi:hypothetical protein
MEEINRLAKELTTACHDNGNPIILAISDGETGGTIRVVDSNTMIDVLVLLGVLVDNIVQNCDGGITTDDILDGLRKILSQIDTGTRRDRADDDDSSNDAESESLKN